MLGAVVALAARLKLTTPAALGTGTDVAGETASAVRMSGDVAGVGRAPTISRATLRNIRQNLFCAFA